MNLNLCFMILLFAFSSLSSEDAVLKQNEAKKTTVMNDLKNCLKRNNFSQAILIGRANQSLFLKEDPRYLEVEETIMTAHNEIIVKLSNKFILSAYSGYKYLNLYHSNTEVGQKAFDIANKLYEDLEKQCAKTGQDYLPIGLYSNKLGIKETDNNKLLGQFASFIKNKQNSIDALTIFDTYSSVFSSIDLNMKKNDFISDLQLLRERQILKMIKGKQFYFALKEIAKARLDADQYPGGEIKLDNLKVDIDIEIINQLLRLNAIREASKIVAFVLPNTIEDSKREVWEKLKKKVEQNKFVNDLIEVQSGPLSVNKVFKGGIPFHLGGKLEIKQTNKLSPAPIIKFDEGVLFTDGFIFGAPKTTILAVGTIKKPVVFKGVTIHLDIDASINCVNTVFIDCELKKGGVWSRWGNFDTKWSFDNCIFINTQFGPSLHGGSVGFKIHNSVVIGMTDLKVEHELSKTGSAEFQSLMTSEMNSVKNTSFYDCSMFPSFFWTTSSCNFYNCELSGSSFYDGTSGHSLTAYTNDYVFAFMVKRLFYSPFCEGPSVRLGNSSFKEPQNLEIWAQIIYLSEHF